MIVMVGGKSDDKMQTLFSFYRCCVTLFEGDLRVLSYVEVTLLCGGFEVA